MVHWVSAVATAQEAIFSQYDEARIPLGSSVKESPPPLSGFCQDGDGILNKEEIIAYVKGEHKFDIAEEIPQAIHHVENNTKQFTGH